MSKSWLELKEKVIVITGGVSGIGKKLARTLKNESAVVVLADHTVKTGEVLDGVYCVQCDTIRQRSVEAMLQAVAEQFGSLDTLIHCVSPQPVKSLIDENHPDNELDEVDFSMAWGVGVKSVYVCAQAAARQMKRQGGGSIVVLIPSTEKADTLTNAVTAAVKALCDGWSEELKDSNITIQHKEISVSHTADSTGAKAVLDSFHAENRLC